jgi:hypothetical protein
MTAWSAVVRVAVIIGATFLAAVLSSGDDDFVSRHGPAIEHAPEQPLDLATASDL